VIEHQLTCQGGGGVGGGGGLFWGGGGGGWGGEKINAKRVVEGDEG